MTRAGLTIDAVVVDVDGTICFDGHTLTPDITAALRETSAAIRLIFASARPIRDLLPVLPPDLHGVDLIGGNGAFLRTAGSATITLRGFDDATRATIDGIVARHRLGALIDGTWDYSYTGDPHHPLRSRIDPHGTARVVPAASIATYSKALLFSTDPAVIAELAELDIAMSVHPTEGAIDIAPGGVTKATAVAAIGATACAAFGNDTNDIDLLRAATVSVRVGHHPGLDFATYTATPDTVADVLRSLIRPDRRGTGAETRRNTGERRG